LLVRSNGSGDVSWMSCVADVVVVAAVVLDVAFEEADVVEWIERVDLAEDMEEVVKVEDDDDEVAEYPSRVMESCRHSDDILL
jgi:hypothetical protein